MYNIVGQTIVLSFVVTIMVWISIQDEIESKSKKIKVLIRSFLFSIVVMFIFIYFTSNDTCDEVISNMNKATPDF
jgi:hypothetical protein